jgi:hypothetical protein
MNGLLARQRFFFNLALLAASFLLIVASVAFGPRGAKGVGLGIGIAECAGSFLFAAALVHQPRPQGHLALRLCSQRISGWSLLACVFGGVAVWEVVQTSVFPGQVSRWLTFANGLVVAVLASAGLVANEFSSERVVHVLEVIDRSDQATG